MGRLGLTSFLGGLRRGARRAARKAMEQVGVWELRQRRLGNLSEGAEAEGAYCPGLSR